MNQFSSPINKDASIPDKFTDIGKSLVAQLESVLLSDSLFKHQ